MPSHGSGKLIALESLRGFAAFYVFAGHLYFGVIGERGSKLALLFQFGQEAVILFFVLSGFVIYLSATKTPEISFGRYFAKRFLRIFPIFLISLGLTATVSTSDTRTLLANLFMLQDFKFGKPGVWFGTYGSNTALWSLSYEWWFYMMFFPIWKYIRSSVAVWLVGSLSLGSFCIYLLAPNQVSLFLIYFSIWWGGAELARFYTQRVGPTLKQMKVSLGTIGTLVLAFACWVAIYLNAGQRMSFGVHPILELRHLIAALVIIGCGCIATLRTSKVVWLVFRPFAFIAPFSYALYVLHIPLVVEARYLSNIANLFVRYIIYTIAAILICMAVEGPLTHLLNRLAFGKFTKHNSVASRSDRQSLSDKVSNTKP